MPSPQWFVRSRNFSGEAHFAGHQLCKVDLFVRGNGPELNNRSRRLVILRYSSAVIVL